MPLGARLKTSVKSKHSFKGVTNGRKFLDRTKGKSSGKDDSDSAERERRPRRSLDSSVERKTHRLSRKFGAFRDTGDERRSMGTRVYGKKSVSEEGTFARGESGRRKLPGRRPVKATSFDLDVDDPSEAGRSDGAGRVLRGRSGKRDASIRGKDLDSAKRERWPQRSFDSSVEGKTHRLSRKFGAFQDTGDERRSLGTRVYVKKSVSAEGTFARGEWGRRNLPGRRPVKATSFDLDEDDPSEMGRSGGAGRLLRGRSGTGDASIRGKDLDRNNRRKSVEALREKPKGGRWKGEEEDVVMEEHEKNKEKPDETAEQKIRKFPSRVLDKTGKKIRISKKSSEDGSAETTAPKKKRRVIKIDPYDISNKRLDDTAPQTETHVEKNVENNVETTTEISKNAQFRTIQPSSSILSFVEDNLLGRRRLVELKNSGYNVKLSAPLDNIPFSTSTERERIEENVFRNKLEFFAAAKISSSFPPPTIPEIAFAGRSNVGKSSLLNALTRQWGVVRTSDKPGLTQTINFFRLASKLSLVDLPGYGFAYAKDEVKDAWEELVKEYVSTRVGLQRVCLLIDTKWGMKPRDHELIDLMERSQTPYHVVLTKTDVVFPIDVARRAMQIQENLKKNSSIVNPVMMVSSKSGAGIRCLRTSLAKLARFVKP